MAADLQAFLLSLPVDDIVHIFGDSIVFVLNSVNRSLDCIGEVIEALLDILNLEATVGVNLEVDLIYVGFFVVLLEICDVIIQDLTDRGLELAQVVVKRDPQLVLSLVNRSNP